MEVRAMHKAGSNQAELHVYHDGKLIAKLECSEGFGKQEFRLTIPQDMQVEGRKVVIVAKDTYRLEVERKLE